MHQTRNETIYVRQTFFRLHEERSPTYDCDSAERAEPTQKLLTRKEIDRQMIHRRRRTIFLVGRHFVEALSSPVCLCYHLGCATKYGAIPRDNAGQWRSSAGVT